DFPHHGGDSRHAPLHAPLGGDVVAHECETEAVALTEFRRDTNSFVPTDDGIAGFHVAQHAADGTAVLDHDGGVHALLFDFRPPSSHPHLGAMVRRRVEIVGNTTVLLGRSHERIALAQG